MRGTPTDLLKALLDISPDVLDLFSPITKRWSMTLTCAVATLLVTSHIRTHDNIMLCPTVILLVFADTEFASQVLTIHDVSEIFHTQPRRFIGDLEVALTTAAPFDVLGTSYTFLEMI